METAICIVADVHLGDGESASDRVTWILALHRPHASLVDRQPDAVAFVEVLEL